MNFLIAWAIVSLLIWGLIIVSLKTSPIVSLKEQENEENDDKEENF